MGKKHLPTEGSSLKLRHHQFAQGLPEKDVLYRIIDTHVAEYQEQRRQARQLQRATIAPVGTVADALAAADQLLESLTATRQLPSGSEHEQHQQFCKKLAAIQRSLKITDAAQAVPFGNKTISLIHIISLLVLHELDDLARLNPVQFARYTTGQDRVYWFKTTTQSLCASLNKSKVRFEIINGTAKDRRNDRDFQNLAASFRGDDGFFACMTAAGFLTEKVNLDSFGNDHEDGRDVRLGINLDWIFGFAANIFTAELTRAAAELAPSEALQTPTIAIETPTETPFFGDPMRGNSSHLGLNLTYGYKETEYNKICAAEPLESSAPEGAQKKLKESEEKKTPLQDNKKNEGETPGPAPSFVEKSEEKDNNLFWDCCQDTAKRALIHLFNAKNQENGRIKYGYNSLPAEITRQDIRDMAHWVADVYRAIRKPEESWLDVAKVVNEAIENTEQYLADHPTRWIYHPKFWLSTSFEKGSLLKYLNVGLSRPIYEKKTVDAQKSENFGDYTQQIAWFLKAGANRDAVNFQIRRIGSDAVSDCIALGGAKMHGDLFKPRNGKVSYIFGIIKGCKPELIRAQAAIAKAKALGEKPKPKPIWTAEKVRAAMEHAVKNLVWRELITETMIQQVTARFAYTQGATEAQIGDIFYQYVYQNHEKLGAL